MFAVAFDFEVAKLKEYYGNPYNNVYYEVKEILSNMDLLGYKGVLV